VDHALVVAALLLFDLRRSGGGGPD